MKNMPLVSIFKGFVATVFALSAVVTSASASANTLDITSPEGQLQAVVKMRANTLGTDVFADWRITAWGVVPGKRPIPMFRLDGFNVGRMERQSDGGYVFMSREVGYYRDVTTGKIIDKWDNPFTKQTDDVLHVVNDPVNIPFEPSSKPGARRPPLEVLRDQVFLRMDIPLMYPNPIKPAEYPQESSGETYIASEHFTYIAKVADVANPALTSAPTQYAWTRVGPWLPWMRMGTTVGYVVYVGFGTKLASAADLESVVREHTERHFPKFMKSPDVFTRPNETSWTYYKKQRPPQGSTAKPDFKPDTRPDTKP